jgi:histidinol-phosphate aminotransferase
MTMKYARPGITRMKGYTPGFQPDPRDKYIKLNSNENPYPPSSGVKDALSRLRYEDLRIYPDPESVALRKKIGSLYGFTPDQIICGNGSDDILNIIVRTFADPGEAIGFHEPTFPLYRVLAAIHGTKAVPLPLAEPYTNPSIPPETVKVFFLANPNSPVGFGYPRARVAEMAKKTKGIFVVDEAYAEFAGENCLDLIRETENVIVVRTLSKSYSLAGVRLGYAIAHEEWVKEMLKVKDPFNVTSLTQALAAAAMEDQVYFRETTQKITKTREWFFQEGTALGYRILPSQANFIFPQPPQKGRGKAFYQALFERRILTRHYDEEGLRDGVRLTIGTQEEMEQVLKVFREILPEFKRT